MKSALTTRQAGEGEAQKGPMKLQHQDSKARHRAYTLAPERPDGVGRARGLRSRRDFRSLRAFAIARNGDAETAVEGFAYALASIGKGVA